MNDSHDSNRSAFKPSWFDTNLDVIEHIIEYLDTQSVVNLSQTNSTLRSICLATIACRKAKWKLFSPNETSAPPVFTTRCGVMVGEHEFVVPFMTSNPCCYILNLDTFQWSRKLVEVDDPNFQPFIAPCVSLHHKIYMFGGRKVRPYRLSNDLYELDMKTMKLSKKNPVEGTPPDPRHEHSVDIVTNRYIVVFGGLIENSAGESDVYLYDLTTDTWIEPIVRGQSPWGRFAHSTAVMNSHDLFVFGGTQVLESDDSNRVFDDLYRLDCRTFTWYKYDWYRSPKQQCVSISHDNTMPTSDECLVPTTGPRPRDRLECGMIAWGHKLLIFNGHTFGNDLDDHLITYDYPLHAIDVFNTRLLRWTRLDSQIHVEDASIRAQNISYAFLPGERGPSVLMIGQQILDKGGSSVESIHTKSDSSFEAHTNEMSGESYNSGNELPSEFLHPITVKTCSRDSFLITLKSKNLAKAAAISSDQSEERVESPPRKKREPENGIIPNDSISISLASRSKEQLEQSDSEMHCSGTVESQIGSLQKQYARNLILQQHEQMQEVINEDNPHTPDGRPQPTSPSFYQKSQPHSKSVSSTTSSPLSNDTHPYGADTSPSRSEYFWQFKLRQNYMLAPLYGLLLMS
ncbi:uncharacterized protein VTP21DRAFT_10544 [Calcarisporiella thermophila]|uniref:uncharacterized protein n=1 Tax=Calcarisporiella thermophila TaxID=911321 RepID=UPI003742D0CF